MASASGLHGGRRLTPREHEVLTGIVRHYVQTGVPAASRTLSKVNSEGLSPATIRGIMAELEEQGYLTHPHTSAGRFPTDMGYRYYVDTLNPREPLTEAERQALRDDLYAAGGMDSLISRCCRLLSVASSMVAVGTGPGQSVIRFRHVELVKLNERRLLVLFISGSGLVQQRVIETPVPETQVELTRYANYLNHELADRTLSEVRDHVADLMEEEQAAYDALARRALDLGAAYFAQASDEGELVVDGTDLLLEEQPSLEDFDRMKSLLVALRKKSRIIRLLNSCLDRTGVTTAIGVETDAPELAGCALVAASYEFEAVPAGTIGIIGPTRMDYDRAMALVEYVSGLLGGALAEARRD